MKIPSDKQIDFVDVIANTLKIDFPQSSCDFFAQNYYLFIKKHIDDFEMQQRLERFDSVDVDDLYYDYYCQNDAWCEHY